MQLAKKLDLLYWIGNQLYLPLRKHPDNKKESRNDNET